MYTVDVKFALPPEIIGGLLSGEYVRRGGIIQSAGGAQNGGEVVGWLREVSTEAGPPTKAATSLGRGAEVLGQLGAVASVINLGATVGFGVAILRRLKKMSEQLVEINDNLDNIAARMECGFFYALQGIDSVLDHMEADLAGKMQASLKAAWTAQLLPPEDRKRELRLEQALIAACEAAARLKILAASECAAERERIVANVAAKRIQALGSGRSLQRLRQLVLMGSLEARLYAETGQLEVATQTAQAWSDLVGGELRALMLSFLRGNSPGHFMHDELLHVAFVDVMPAMRIDRWMRCFDESQSLDGMLTFLRRQGNATPMHAKDRYASADAAALGKFAEGVDGLIEDLDRLEGLAPEYRACMSMGLSIQEYRRMLQVPDAPQPRCLALLLPKVA